MLAQAEPGPEHGKFSQFIQYYRQNAQLKREAKSVLAIGVSLFVLSYLPIPIVASIIFYFATTYTIASAIDLWATWRFQRNATLFIRWVNAAVLWGGLQLVQKLAELLNSTLSEQAQSTTNIELQTIPLVSPALARLGRGSHPGSAGYELEDQLSEERMQIPTSSLQQQISSTVARQSATVSEGSPYFTNCFT